MLSPSDAELAAREPALPGIALLLDGEAFSDRVRDLFPVLPPRRLIPVYVRYKPQTSCLVAYGEAPGEPPVLYAVARNRSAADKLRKAAAVLDAGRDSGVGVLEDEAVEVRGAAHDAVLPVLASFLDATKRRHALERRFSHLPELTRSGLVPLAYKPERRFVARLDGRDEPAAVLRLYALADFGRAAPTAGAFRSRRELRIARPLGSSRRHRALVLEWLPGEPLSSALGGGGSAVDLVRRTGRALAELHRQEPRRPLGARPTLEAESRNRAVASVGALQPCMASLAERVAERTADVHRHVSSPRPLHGDFYAAQVVVAPDGIGLLDLDRARFGDPAADLGEFIAHLEWDAISGARSQPEIEELGDALITGYRSKDANLPRRVPAHAAAALLRLADMPFRRRDPDWPVAMERILDRASELARGAVRSVPLPARRTLAPAVPAANTAAGRLAADAAFPFILPAMDPDYVGHRLARIFEDRLGEPIRADLRGVRVLRHKPGRRCLLEYDLWLERAGSPPESMPLLGKVRARGLDERSYRVQQALWKAGFGEDQPHGVGVPEPIGTLPELRMWLQRKVAGRSLLPLLAGPGSRDLARRVVRAADRLHRLDLVPERVHDLADELRILRDRLGRLAHARPQLAGRLERVLAGCESVASSLEPLASTGIHRDFYHDQLLVDGERLYLLDLDLYCTGDPALDIGNFLAHLLEHDLRTGGSVCAIEEAQTEIEDRFAELHAGAPVRAAVHAYTTFALARLVQIASSFPDRDPFTEALLEACEARIGRHNSALLV